MKKFFSIVLTLVMMFSLASCGEKTDVVETDLSKPVTLNWIMPGPGEQKDSKMVWDKFNEELKKIEGFENVTVNIEVIPMADYAQKIMLMQSSGEKMDLIQTYMLDYVQEFRNGTIIDIAPYLKKYAKETLDELPEWVVNMGKVDGSQAILPNYQKMIAAPFYATIPAELAQYTDAEKLAESFMKDEENHFTPSDESVALVEEYLEKVTAAGKLGKGYFDMWKERGTESVISFFKFYYQDPEIKIFHSHLGEQQQAMWRITKDFFNKGYVRKDALSAKASDSFGVKNGNVSWPSQNWTGKFEVYDGDKKYDIKTLQIPTMDHYYVPYKPAAGGLAIPQNSEYPDVAAMLINLMNSSKGIDLYNLMVYGIEGTHYTVDKDLDGDDKMITPKDYPEEGNSASAYGLQKWIVGNAKNAYVTSNQNEDFKKVIYDYMNEGESTITSPLMGFALNADTIETKLGIISAIDTEFRGPIESGAADTEKLIGEMTEKYNQANIQEVIDEIQSQVDAFLASK